MRDLTLVFDLDGTLVDTAPDLVASTNHVLDHLGLPRWTSSRCARSSGTEPGT